MGFTTVTMIKTDTLCNENNYGTEKKKKKKKKKKKNENKEKYNMKYHDVADSKFIFSNTWSIW